MASIRMQSEADRRQNLIDDLLTREKHLNATFKGDVTEPEPSRYLNIGRLSILNEREKQYLQISPRANFFQLDFMKCVNLNITYI